MQKNFGRRGGGVIGIKEGCIIGKDLIIKGIKDLIESLYTYYINTIWKRVPFTYKDVAGAELPHFSARLYREVKLLN
jgi:hypothetical protein